MSSDIVGFFGKSLDGKKSRVPARLDLIQSATGLILGLFMWAHMVFISTILISPSFFDKTVNFLELNFMFGGHGTSYATSFFAFSVFVIFFLHAGLGMRKFPINFRQWQVYRAHMNRMKHSDTNLWFIQATTGFIMFFLGSAHLIFMITNAEYVNAAMSSYRVSSHFMWLIYLILLFAVELHGGIGLYRLCVKWGWFEGKDVKESRRKLTKAKWIISAIFVVIGLLSLAAFFKIGSALENPRAEKIVEVVETVDNNGGILATDIILDTDNGVNE